MARGVGVERPHDDLDLGLHPRGLLLAGAAHGEGAGPLAVQPHVFGEALRKQHCVALVHKEAEGSGVLVNVAAGKALVGHVEEGEQVPLLDDGGHLLPLLQGWVDAGGVVRTGVQEDHGSLGRR